MVPWIVVGFYTVDTLYERKVKTLITTLNLNKVLYFMERVPNLGSWYKNTNYKPTFLKRMLKEFQGLDIIYTDVDVKFMKYPVLFDILDCDIAVHEFDRSNWPRGRGTEVLSGTIFLKNNERVFNLVEKW
ncbi:MAG: putative nucleotide-diphospho-sugar transferase, partial [Nitrosopumilus sp.]